MAQTSSFQSAATLKQLSYRISSTPTEHLPRITPQIASSIWNCRDLIASTSPTTKHGGDDGIIVHRFKTQLTTLLQDRTVEGRWAAVVLVKATIEAGGLEVLSKSNGWVKNLLGIMKKPDPSTTRSLAAIALTRIFMLTWDHSNLVREITTPNLPAFISTCLSNAENKRCSSSELQTILEALATLVPRHPTIFRTHEYQLRALLNRIVSSTASSGSPTYYPQVHVGAAQRLLASLHHCAPKQGAAEKWAETLKSTIAAAHSTCDRVFRSVVEDWKSTTSVQSSVPAQQLMAGEAELEGEDAAGLSGWRGIHAGGERVVSLVSSLEAQMSNATASTTTVRIGLVADLLTRLLSVTTPSSARQNFIKPNQQISKDEREILYAALPGIHVAAFKLVSSLLDRFGNAITSVIPNFRDQITWVFRAEKSDPSVKTAAYNTLRKMLILVGPTLDRDEVADLGQFMTACCSDLLPEDSDSRQQNESMANGKPQNTSHTPSIFATQPTVLESSASLLLPILLSKLNPRLVSRKLRAQLDRTAVLAKHKDALVASVLNPALNASGTGMQPSLLPFLAKMFPGAAEVEAILRPRMPVVQLERRKAGGADEVEDDEDEEAEEEEELEEEDAKMQDGNAAEAEGDLLSALDEHIGTSSQDAQTTAVSASTTAQQLPGLPVTAPQDSSTAKRAASSALDAEAAAKRQRSSLIGMALPTSAPPALPEASAAATQPAVPATVVFGQGQQSATIPSSATASTPVPVQLAAPTAEVADNDEDDSDMEMPPLTMESDTEDEEEEEEDDE